MCSIIPPIIQRERYVSRLTWSSALSQLSPAQAGEAGSEAAWTGPSKREGPYWWSGDSGGPKIHRGGMRSRLQLTYNSVCNLSEDKSFVMKSIYLISISTEHFISTDRTQGGKSRCKDLCSDIDVQFKRNRTKHSLNRSEKIFINLNKR